MKKLILSTILMISSNFAFAGQICTITKVDLKNNDEISKAKLEFDKPELLGIRSIKFSYDGSLTDLTKQLEIRRLNEVCDSFIFNDK